MHKKFATFVLNINIKIETLCRWRWWSISNCIKSYICL